MDFKLTSHAQEEIARRSIPRAVLESVLNDPQQIVPQESGRKVYQSKVDFGGGTIFLVRAIVDDRVNPPALITVYRTSKIEKYWRTS